MLAPNLWIQHHDLLQMVCKQNSYLFKCLLCTHRYTLENSVRTFCCTGKWEIIWVSICISHNNNNNKKNWKALTFVLTEGLGEVKPEIWIRQCLRYKVKHVCPFFIIFFSWEIKYIFYPEWLIRLLSHELSKQGARSLEASESISCQQ